MPDDINLRAELTAGRTVLGTFVFEFGTSGVGPLAANAGAEFIMYDLEHSAFGWETLRLLCAATDHTSAIPLARVPAAERAYVSRALDLGARGIMVPMVGDAATAELIVSWARYPPSGSRGAIFGTAHDGYGEIDPDGTMRKANDRTIVIAQIENASGLAEVDAIAAVEGIDVLWLGQFDLTNSLGIPGQFDHPDYRNAFDRVARVAVEHGKTAGFMAMTAAEAIAAKDHGYRMLAYSGDLWIYRDALAAGITQIRTALGNG